MSSFKERLQECIEEANVSRSELAEKTRICHSNISDYLSGTHTPSFKHFIALISVFDCSADYLLGLTDIHSEEKTLPVPPFSQQLRLILKMHGVSQGKLLRDLKISSSALYKWLSGAGPRTDTLKKLADYFGCSVDFLIGRIQ